jgi:hypothetical protein
VSENPKSVELHEAIQQLRLYQESKKNLAAETAPVTDNLTAAAVSDVASTASVNDGGPNVVTVDPGGASFSTIGEAIASITDASQQKQYLLTASPGTFNEKVTLKPWVFLQGSGQENTTITAPPTSDTFSRGTVTAASNSGISNLTVSCTGGSWGDWNSALVCAGVVGFYAESLVLAVNDLGNAGINLQTVGIDTNLPNSGNSQVYLAYCFVESTGQSGDSTSMNLLADENSYVEVTDSKLIAQGGNSSFGAASNGGASLNIFDSYVQGSTFALDIPDYSSTLIATNCQINGPVSNGVQIINDPPPSE